MKIQIVKINKKALLIYTMLFFFYCIYDKLFVILFVKWKILSYMGDILEKKRKK